MRASTMVERKKPCYTVQTFTCTHIILTCAGEISCNITSDIDEISHKQLRTNSPPAPLVTCTIVKTKTLIRLFSRPSGARAQLVYYTVAINRLLNYIILYCACACRWHTTTIGSGNRRRRSPCVAKRRRKTVPTTVAIKDTHTAGTTRRRYMYIVV